MNVSVYLELTEEIYSKLLEKQFKNKDEREKIKILSFVVRVAMGTEGRMQAR